MTNINPNCDGSRTADHGYKEVRLYPLGNGGNLRLCLPCFANEILDRYRRAKEARRGCDLSPPPERAEWYRLESLRLANGDNVGVAARVRISSLARAAGAS